MLGKACPRLLMQALFFLTLSTWREGHALPELPLPELVTAMPWRLPVHLLPTYLLLPQFLGKSTEHLRVRFRFGAHGCFQTGALNARSRVSRPNRRKRRRPCYPRIDPVSARGTSFANCSRTLVRQDGNSPQRSLKVVLISKGGMVQLPM